MLKSASQMRFQQQSQNLQKQLQIFSQRISRITSFQKINLHLQTYSQLNTKIKSINSLFNKIDTEMRMKKNYNQYDLKEKLRRYLQIREKLMGKYESVGREIEAVKRKYLVDRRVSRESGLAGDGSGTTPFGNRDIEMKNMNKANQIMSRYQGVNDDLKETQNITSAWIPELHTQGQNIHEMRTDLKETEAELGMVDQLMRIIKNRHLMTKVLLLVMILLMGLVDVMLFVIKIL